MVPPMGGHIGLWRGDMVPAKFYTACRNNANGRIHWSHDNAGDGPVDVHILLRWNSGNSRF